MRNIQKDSQSIDATSVAETIAGNFVALFQATAVLSQLVVTSGHRELFAECWAEHLEADQPRLLAALFGSEPA